MIYDIAVIGGGPGGYTAAIRGAQLGGKVCLIEEAQMGGTCLNRGCIPSKAYFEAAKRIDFVKSCGDFGLNAQLDGFDLSRCVARKDSIVARLTDGIASLLKGQGIDVINARGRLAEAGLIEAIGPDKNRLDINAKKIIIATGSRPAMLPGLKEDGQRIVTSDSIWSVNKTPKSLAIIGGGVIGCELANIFAAFGSHVTILEGLPVILATEDREASRAVQKSFKERGIDIRTGISVQGVVPGDAAVKIEISEGDDVECDMVVVAVGRAANTRGLGLEEAGVELNDRGKIIAGDDMRTSVENIYAVGDAVGRFMLAHVASSEGLAAAANCLGGNKQMDYSAVPYAIFTSPEIASVGEREAGLKENGTPYNVGRFALSANGKALCMGEVEGFVKILSHSETGVVLGASIVGPHASDLIAEITTAVQNKSTTGDLAATIHVHPSVGEAVLEAAEDAMGMAIHKIGRKTTRRR